MEEPIPARDQIIEGGHTAADGRHFPGACNTLGEFITSIEDGQFSADVYTDLKELNATLHEHAMHNGGKAKGKLVLTFEIAQDGGLNEIRSAYKITKPEQKRSKTVLWQTEDNRFTRNKPNQRELFGLRDASTPTGGFRDA